MILRWRNTRWRRKSAEPTRALAEDTAGSPRSRSVAPLLKGPCRLQVWLQKYGYLPAPGPRASALRSAATMQSALAAMQQFYGINTTGRVDADTLA